MLLFLVVSIRRCGYICTLYLYYHDLGQVNNA